MDFAGRWDEHLPLMEVAYKNSYQEKIYMAPLRPCMGRGGRQDISVLGRGWNPTTYGTGISSDHQGGSPENWIMDTYCTEPAKELR